MRQLSGYFGQKTLVTINELFGSDRYISVPKREKAAKLPGCFFVEQ
jgi:hypothetical protein